jgi:hypothetical protein
VPIHNLTFCFSDSVPTEIHNIRKLWLIQAALFVFFTTSTKTRIVSAYLHGHLLFFNQSFLTFIPQDLLVAYSYLKRKIKEKKCSQIFSEGFPRGGVTNCFGASIEIKQKFFSMPYRELCPC